MGIENAIKDLQDYRKNIKNKKRNFEVTTEKRIEKAIDDLKKYRKKNGWK